MSADWLLLWMSARREGSWQQFRSAVEELHVEDENGEQGETGEDSSDQYTLPLYQVLRLNMQRLGHAEFFAGASASDWRVAPPSLAVTKHTHGWLGVLAGARSKKLLQQLHDSAGPENLETLRFPSCPGQIRILAQDACSLVAVGEQVGLVVQHEAPTAILTSLPPIDDLAVRRRTDLPFGADWRIEQFSASDLGWKAATREEARSTSGGLFRFSLHHQRQILLCSKGAAFQIPGQVGKYLLLKHRRRRVLRYDAANRRVLVPASCRPPFLVERALILCSGTPPSFEVGSGGAGFLHYADVPQAVARLVSALLRQEIR